MGFSFSLYPPLPSGYNSRLYYAVMAQVCRRAGTLPGALSSNLSHMSSSFHRRLPRQKVPSAITEELSAPAAGHAAARYAQSPLNLLKDILEQFITFFSHSMVDYAEMPEMAGERLNSCGFNFLLSRTTWRALCATSARPASSTCRRATPRAASSASAWASPGSAAAPLGAETRHVFRGLTHPDTKAGLSVCAVMFRRS